MPAPTASAVHADILRESLPDMLRSAWPIIEPGVPLVWTWHLDAICEHLEAVSRGELRRLIVNIPPRCSKSSTVSVVWPVWDWLTNPGRRFLFASYAQQLATRDAVKSRRIIQSEGVLNASDGRERTLIEHYGYQGVLRLLGERWALAGDQNLKMRYENDRTGYRISGSVGGSITGEGGDILVIDDPHKADEVNTETGIQRQNVLDWHDETWSSRLNNRKTGSMVLIMQRLHEQDLTGHLLEHGGWTHLCLPNEYEPSHPFVWPDDPRSEPGELLVEDRIDAAATSELKIAQGSYGYAGQYQQRPAPAEGGIFKTAWWRYYDPRFLDEAEWPTHAPQFQRVWQSWDTALKEKTTSDWTVGQLWGQDLANRYLLRQVRGRWSLTDALTQVEDLTRWAAARFPRHASHSIFVENAAMGPELMAAARRALQGVVGVDPDKDKVARAHAITPQLEAGNVFLPGAANAEGTGCDTALTRSWAQELINECASFPNAAHDDQVDALTQALDPRRLGGGATRRREPGQRSVSSRVRAGGT